MQNLLQNISVIMHQTSHSGNIGSACRAMKTMGLTHLILSDPKCEAKDQQAISLASGAVDVLENATVTSQINDALSESVFTIALTARPRNIVPNVYDVRDGTKLLLQYAQHGKVTMLFGPERTGLTNEDIEKCQAIVHIPTGEIYSALNIASAIQIACYELRMHTLPEKEIYPPAEIPPAKQQYIEGFYNHLEKTLYDLEFINHKQPNKIMPKLRKLFSRVILTNEEVNILRGILSAILQKITKK